jgi:hypothetical protein
MSRTDSSPPAAMAAPLGALLVAFLLVASACATRPVGSAAPSLVVPALAPDSLPGWLLEDVDPEYGVRPDVLYVIFRPGLSPNEKRAVLISVGVVAVVGGVPSAGPPFLDGAYVVRVATGDDMARLIQALDALEARDEVVVVGLYSQLYPG